MSSVSHPKFSDDLFKKKYANLNSKQKEAVDTIEGPVMVIAGPGTGKTTILTLRIANILQKTDTPASGILAITYTDAGAKNMRVKLRELIGSRADEVRIHTFHGFAASVISEFHDHFPHLSKSEQITDIEAESIVRSILADVKFADIRPFGNPDMYIGPILGAIRECKKEAWTPSVLRSFAEGEAERVRKSPESISTRGASKGELKADAKNRIERLKKTMLLADVFELYEEAKRGKYHDFDDLLIELLAALGNDPLLLQLLQEKFLYLLVDEHQDTNDSQNLLVRLIADFFESPNLFVVGDEKQAIYRFQGASVENFLRFQTIWKDMKIISLDDNYRSHQDILDAGFAMIEHNYEEGEHAALRIPLRSHHAEKRPIDIVTAGNIFAEETWLSDEIQRITTKEPEATVAVIVRKNKLVERVLSSLETRGMSASAERGADIFSHPAGMMFFDLIRYMSDPAALDALSRTIAAGLWRISFEDSVRLIQELRAGKHGNIESSIPDIATLLREKNRAGALAFIIRIAEVSGLTNIVSKDPLSVEVWRGILTLSEEIIRRLSIENPSELMKELLSYATSAESRSVKLSFGKPDAKVTVMTAHGSKGLEFDYVFIPYATEDSWMTERRGASFILPREKGEEDNVRDIRRLFYVALTRAKKHVAISSSIEGIGGRESIPVRFISELPMDHIKAIEIPARRDIEALLSVAPLSMRESMLADFARRTLFERGLSVTALNHFIACPARYFYKSIMRLPEAPSASAEKGNAMHAAIDALWKSNIKTKEGIEQKIVEVVREYFNTKSMLPAFERQSVVEELVENAPKVAMALWGHFSQGGDIGGEVSSETWAETSYKDIRLHGKLDAVISSGDTLSIFDYKTRESMSENEIRGNTKNSTGDYFRQLVFYKLLLKQDPRGKGKNIEPALVFVAPDAKGRCPIVTLPITKSDEDKVLADVDRLIESVNSGNILRETCDDPECKECALRRFTNLY